MALSAILTDNAGSTVLDMSDLARSKSVTPRLNLPGTARCQLASQELPSDLDDGGYRMQIALDGTLLHNGFVWAGSDDGDENACYTTVQSVDPTILFGKRLARAADGDFSKPSFLTTYTTAPEIMQAILAHTVTYAGTMPITVGTVATGGVDVSGAPTDWPMTIQEIQALLVNTGELDVVVVPVDVGPLMATVDLHNGDFGTDLTGSVVFDYATGAYNVRRIQRSWSMADVTNRLRYYLGPRRLTASDPAGDQHWAGSVTSDGYPDGAGGALALPNPPGGDLDFPNPLGDLISESRSTFGVMEDVGIYDGDGVNYAAALYARLWQTEALLRANPKRMLSITPVRGLAPDFHIGDLITLNAGAKLRGGFSGAVQRIYAYTVSEDENGVVSIDSIVASPDQEAL